MPIKVLNIPVQKLHRHSKMKKYIPTKKNKQKPETKIIPMMKNVKK